MLLALLLLARAGVGAGAAATSWISDGAIHRFVRAFVFRTSSSLAETTGESHGNGYTWTTDGENPEEIPPAIKLLAIAVVSVICGLTIYFLCCREDEQEDENPLLEQENKETNGSQ